MRSTHALVREVATSFSHALAMVRPEEPIDVARARAQHRSYVEAIGSLGVETIVLPADDACPDCCFVEDACVIAGEVAVVTRPGAESRRAEVESVAAVVARHRLLARIEEPGTLDGGDCMLVGRTFYVGRSKRTNDVGIAALRAIVAPLGFDVVSIALPDSVLHLKSVCSPVGDGNVLVIEGALPGIDFEDARTIAIPASEPQGANVVFANGTALVAADAPRTIALVDRLGVRVVPVDTSEMRKADGALTCLSIVL